MEIVRANVGYIPHNGDARDVSPNSALLKLKFDRPMQNGSRWLAGGRPNFPEIAGKPGLDDTCKVGTVLAKLKSTWAYQCMLNSQRFTGFGGADGTPLEAIMRSFNAGPSR